jgi:predicted GIY-YIG superfamily endonuclease
MHEEFSTRRQAMHREKELKSSRGRAWIRRIIESGC